MAANQIPVPNTTPRGQDLLSYRQQLLAYRQQDALLKVNGAAILAKLAAMADGSDYTQLESQLNLVPGTGHALFDQVNSVVGNFRDSDSRATVNAAIDQFDAFVG